ncbi:hypothetical protein K9M74_01105 [Candidatus Woesearchaeota archaeon]|nr:hypothetical protein [Candidatus Woesearchaeota archaeon]
MHKITQIGLGSSNNEMKYKIVNTTAGTFKTRCSAYNQTLERIEKILETNAGTTLSGPPIKIWTFMYDREFKPRQKFLHIKQLTESRLTGKKFYGVDVFDYEIDFLKKQLSNSDKVVVVNHLMPLKHWDVFNNEDILSMSIALAKTNTPHVSIPLSPKWTAEECIDVIKETKKHMTEEQTYFLTLHPHMDLDEEKRLLNSISSDVYFQGIMINGATPMEAHNMVFYRQASKILPDNKLIMFVNVNDVFGGFKLPTQMAFRMLNADITCRSVKPYLAGNIFNDERKKSINKIGIYVDEVGAILNDHEQRQWTEKSATEFLTEYFSLRNNVNFREIAMAYNFQALNKTGELERNYIDQKIHEKYIEDRVHLSAFMNSVQKVEVRL